MVILPKQLLQCVCWLLNCTFHHDTSTHPYQHGRVAITHVSYSNHELSNKEDQSEWASKQYSCYTMCVVLSTVPDIMICLHIPIDMVDDLVHTHHTHIMRYHTTKMGENRLLSNTAVTPCVLCCSL